MSQLLLTYANYSHYFPVKQKVFLINVSRERDKDQYDSLSGDIVANSGETFDLQVPYSTGQVIAGDRIRNTTFKVITESNGVGLQITADLVNIPADNILRLRLSSVLEVFKQLVMPRIDTTIKMYHHRENSTLLSCKSKFIHLVEQEKKGLPFHLTLRENPVNVSASGIRIVTESSEKSSPLALCLLDLEDGQPPVCAIAETTWQRRIESGTVTGHRFINILKSDQKRIGRYVQAQQKSQGIRASAPRNNWVLLDRMTFDH